MSVNIHRHSLSHFYLRVEITQLKSSKPVLDRLIEEDKIKIIWAFYDLENGKVDII